MMPETKPLHSPEEPAAAPAWWSLLSLGSAAIDGTAYTVRSAWGLMASAVSYVPRFGFGTSNDMDHDDDRFADCRGDDEEAIDTSRPATDVVTTAAADALSQTPINHQVIPTLAVAQQTSRGGHAATPTSSVTAQETNSSVGLTPPATARDVNTLDAYIATKQKLQDKVTAAYRKAHHSIFSVPSYELMRKRYATDLTKLAAAKKFKNYMANRNSGVTFTHAEMECLLERHAIRGDSNLRKFVIQALSKEMVNVWDAAKHHGRSDAEYDPSINNWVNTNVPGFTPQQTV